MSDRIEPGCLAAVINKVAAIVVGADIVSVITYLPPDELVRMLESIRYSDRSGFVGTSALIAVFGIDKMWIVANEESGFQKIMPEQLMRRLPPPDIESLTARKDTSVPA